MNPCWNCCNFIRINIICRRTYTKYKGSAYTNEAEYEVFALMDMKLFWTSDDWQVYLTAKNIADKDYVDIGNVLQPGRWLTLGANYTINLKSE